MKRNLIDLHIHSNFSDGKLSISELVDLYGQKGFSAIAITDHLADSSTIAGSVARKLKLSLTEKNMDQYLQTIYEQSVRAWKDYNMLLIPGVEVTLNSWSRQKGAHIVFLGVNRFIDPNTDIESLLLANRDCFSIAAHPIWEESFEFKTTYLWDQRKELEIYFDAWEAATANRFSREVFQSDYPVIFSSDFHAMPKFESWKSQTYLEEITTQCLFKNIRSKKIEPIWI